MKYCYECGTKLTPQMLKGEGMIPYCPQCGKYRFPIFSTAVSMIVRSPQHDKILLIQQYGTGSNVLVAGYINKGESAEEAVVREVKEEIGIDVSELDFNKTAYFARTNTLMINFVCTADTTDLSRVNTEEVDKAAWFTPQEALAAIKPDSLAQRFLRISLND